jgi:hypothetical protein
MEGDIITQTENMKQDTQTTNVIYPPDPEQVTLDATGHREGRLPDRKWKNKYRIREHRLQPSNRPENKTVIDPSRRQKED